MKILKKNNKIKYYFQPLFEMEIVEINMKTLRITLVKLEEEKVNVSRPISNKKTTLMTLITLDVTKSRFLL